MRIANHQRRLHLLHQVVLLMTIIPMTAACMRLRRYTKQESQDPDSFIDINGSAEIPTNTKSILTNELEEEIVEAYSTRSSSAKRKKLRKCADENYCNQNGVCYVMEDSRGPRNECRCKVGYEGTKCEFPIDPERHAGSVEAVTDVVNETTTTGVVKYIEHHNIQNTEVYRTISYSALSLFAFMALITILVAVYAYRRWWRKRRSGGTGRIRPSDLSEINRLCHQYSAQRAPLELVTLDQMTHSPEMSAIWYLTVFSENSPSNSKSASYQRITKTDAFPPLHRPMLPNATTREWNAWKIQSPNTMPDPPPLACPIPVCDQNR